MANLNIFLDGVIIVGLLIIFFTMKNRMKIQSGLLTKYKEMLDSVKAVTDIYDIDKIKKYVELSEETIKAEHKKEIEKSERALMEALEVAKAVIKEDKDKLKSLLESATLTAMKLFMYVPPELREDALQKSPDGPLKHALSKDKEIPFLGVQPENERNALRDLFAQTVAGKGIKSNML